MRSDADERQRRHDYSGGSRGAAPGESRRSEESVPDYFSTEKIFRRVHATAEQEIGHSSRVLFMSGLAAGLSLGLSFVASTAFAAVVPGDGAELVGNLLYPLGFILVIGGRYQLFTENTLTPVTLVLTGRASILNLSRLWSVVLVANVIGAAAIAAVLAWTSILSPDGAHIAHATATHAITGSWIQLFWRGVFAGWLIASLVWLIHASDDSTMRFLLIFIITYAIAVGGFEHSIIGACEVLYLMFQGGTGVGMFLHYFTAVVVGNIAGGVILVAILNYAQMHDEETPEQQPE